MEVNVLKDEGNILEFEIGGDQILLRMLSDKLNEDKSVEFAAYKVDHPQIGRPTLFVKTKKKDALPIVLEKLGELQKEVSEFSKEFKSVVEGK